MFALAVGNFSVTYQTFVHQHARMIAPGKSVFISHQSFDDPELPGPHLFSLKQKPRVSNSSFTLGPMAPLVPRNRLISRFLREHGVDTVMVEFGTYAVKIASGVKAAKCKFFVHFHGWDASSALRDRTLQRKYDELFKTADGFFAPSRFLADRLIAMGCPKDHIWVTPCGVDVDQFPMITGDAMRCLAVGRFVEKKAPLATVEAFAKAARKFPDAHLDYVGGGPLLDDALSLASKLGVSHQITFHGEKSHDVVKELLGKASIFLQHSVTAPDGNVEGLPVAILEAMCSGLAVVSTRHSGIPEAVQHGHTGLLVEEHDTDAMGECIQTLFQSKTDTEAMGKLGRDRAIEYFNIELSIKTLRERMAL